MSGPGCERQTCSKRITWKQRFRKKYLLRSLYWEIDTRRWTHWLVTTQWRDETYASTLKRHSVDAFSNQRIHVLVFRPGWSAVSLHKASVILWTTIRTFNLGDVRGRFGSWRTTGLCTWEISGMLVFWIRHYWCFAKKNNYCTSTFGRSKHKPLSGQWTCDIDIARMLSWVILFAETFRLFVRNGLKTSVIFFGYFWWLRKALRLNWLIYSVILKNRSITEKENPDTNLKKIITCARTWLIGSAGKISRKLSKRSIKFGFKKPWKLPPPRTLSHFTRSVVAYPLW